MSYRMFCPNCNREVNVKKNWSAGSIIILIILLGGGLFLGLIYLLYKSGKDDRCYSCGMPARMMLSIYDRGQVPGTPVYNAFSCSPEQRVCPSCGDISTGIYCTRCGQKVR